jgi:hypothetical protein
VLVFLASPYPRGVLVLPMLWCILGATAVFLLGMPEDLELLIAGIVGAVLLAGHRAAFWSARGV